MLVSRSREQASPLAMSRVIARSLLQDLRSGDSTFVGQGAENIVRLVDMYRLDTFNARQRTGILRQDKPSDVLFSSDRQDLRRLKEALRATHESFSQGSSVADFAQDVAAIFKQLAESANAPAADDVARADRFLSMLISSLSTT